MQNELKIAICDDDKVDRTCLRQALEAYFETEKTSIDIMEYEDGEELKKEKASKFDLIFLDIYMKNSNGMDIAKDLVEKYKGIHIVFLSSSKEYAAESYDVDALHYLIKPLNREKLQQVLDRYMYAIKKTRTIVIKQNRMEKSILLDDIYWIEARAHSCMIHTRLGDEECASSLSDMEMELIKYDFMRVSRYALVSLNEVASVPGKDIVLNDGTIIPVSKKLQGIVLDAFRANRWKSMFRESGK